MKNKTISSLKTKLWIQFYPLVIAIFMLPFFAVLLMDAQSFCSIQKGEYKTPWYDSRWWVSPYPSLRVAFAEPRVYWTTNAVGSERWLVKETVIGDKEWWTTLQRIPIGEE